MNIVVNARMFLRPAVATGLLLLIPLVMTWRDRGLPEGEGWRWSAFDFAVMGALLFSAGLAYEILAGGSRDRRRKALLGLAILLVVCAIWAELAVGALSRLLAFATA